MATKLIVTPLKAGADLTWHLANDGLVGEGDEWLILKEAPLVRGKGPKAPFELMQGDCVLVVSQRDEPFEPSGM